MIRAVIFDMDGVLVEAQEWHYEALNDALGPFGCAISRSDHLTRFNGLPTRIKLKMLSDENALSPDLHMRIFEMKQANLLRIVRDRCKPYPAHQHALAKLREADYGVAVASNSIRHTIEVVMELTQLSRYLDFIVSNEDVEKPKPHPEMYLRAIARLGLQPQECLAVEDSAPGIGAARASGARVLVVDSIDDVTWPNLEREIARLGSIPAD